MFGEGGRRNHLLLASVRGGGKGLLQGLVWVGSWLTLLQVVKRTNDACYDRVIKVYLFLAIFFLIMTGLLNPFLQVIGLRNFRTAVLCCTDDMI